MWHVDFTVVPTSGGLWVPWMPRALVQRWPFAWWVAVVLDQYSRAVIAQGVFEKQPTAEEAIAVLERAVRNAGRRPRYIVSDRGVQFQDKYQAWCKRRGVRPRFGAIGKKGSIAIIERFIRSMKQEHVRRILVPLSIAKMRRSLDRYVHWYNEARPHTALGGDTPRVRLNEPTGAIGVPGFETRPAYPVLSRRRVRGLELVVTRFDGEPHLPIVELRDAA